MHIKYLSSEVVPDFCILRAFFGVSPYSSSLKREAEENGNRLTSVQSANKLLVLLLSVIPGARWDRVMLINGSMSFDFYENPLTVISAASKQMRQQKNQCLIK